MLEAQGITVRYSDRVVLDNVNLRLPRGNVTAIVGPNGAGKSTLLSALSGAIRPTGGRALIDGRDVSETAPAELATQRAVLEQTPARHILFPVLDLINLAIDRSVPPDQAEKIANRALQAFDLVTYRQTPIARLSGGEAHRAHLARTMAQLWAGQALGAPGFLLIDEPTASLDMAHQHAVLTVAKDAAKDGAGVLIILHDLTLAAAVADRIVVLQDGIIAAEGSVEEVLSPTVLEPVYGVPIAVLKIDGQNVITPLFQSQETQRPSAPDITLRDESV